MPAFKFHVAIKESEKQNLKLCSLCILYHIFTVVRINNKEQVAVEIFLNKRSRPSQDNRSCNKRGRFPTLNYFSCKPVQKLMVPFTFFLVRLIKMYKNVPKQRVLPAGQRDNGEVIPTSMPAYTGYKNKGIVIWGKI